MVKPVHSNRFKEKFIKISTKKGGCTMKIFGDQLNPTIPYKTFVLSNKDTVEWIVKEMLEKYGLKHVNAKDYRLLMIVIPLNGDIRERILQDDDCPLNVYLNHSSQGKNNSHSESIVFKVIKCSTMSEQQPMLIEVNSSDGSNLPTPQVFHLQSTRIYLGRNVQFDNPRESIYIDADGINIDHCILDNHHGLITVIPLGEVWLDGKLMTKSFSPHHHALICFGRNSTFRFHATRRRSSISSVYENDEKKQVDVLPGLVEVSQEMEIRFLQSVFNHDPFVNQHFRLIPVCILYMTLRFRLSALHQHVDDVNRLVYRIENLLHQTIDKYREQIDSLTYWLANTSELLFFLQYDRDLSPTTGQIQMRLIKQIQRIFFYLINELENALDRYLIIWTNSSHIKSNDNLFEYLSSIVDLFRKCRLNPRITLAIFSRLFYYINTFLFNRIVCQSDLKLCSRWTGDLIAYQLDLLDHWALEQGLESLTERYLLKLRQLSWLLQIKKFDQKSIEQFLSKGPLQINAIQLREIFRNYVLEVNEPPITKYFSQRLLTIAEKDLIGQGTAMKLVEEANLDEPFHLPDDGYAMETLRGIPQPLLDFIEPMHRAGLCRLYTNVLSLGFWTEFLQTDDQTQTIVLNKKNNTLGLNIVFAENQSRQIRGIYVKNIISGSVAEENGQLQMGDQILRVNHLNLRNTSQEQATDILKRSGPIVKLEIRKNAALKHGLSTLFSSSSTPSTPKSRPLIIREDIPNDTQNSSLSEMEFEEKLKRRLAQFEQERTMERDYMERMSAKRQAEMLTQLREDRERELRAQQALENFQRQRMSTSEQISAEKREQTRLLKHMCLPIRKSLK